MHPNYGKRWYYPWYISAPPFFSGKKSCFLTMLMLSLNLKNALDNLLVAAPMWETNSPTASTITTPDVLSIAVLFDNFTLTNVWNGTQILLQHHLNKLLLIKTVTFLILPYISWIHTMNKNLTLSQILTIFLTILNTSQEIQTNLLFNTQIYVWHHHWLPTWWQFDQWPLIRTPETLPFASLPHLHPLTRQLRKHSELNMVLFLLLSTPPNFISPPLMILSTQKPWMKMSLLH